MTATRSRSEEKGYRKYLKTVKSTTCVFCVMQKGNDQYVEETTHFKVIKNIFPYSLWDGQKVVAHLMVTPKKHTDSLKTMEPSEKVEYVDLLEKYEKMGYNIYLRAPTSVIKSIVHQHTHLIKTEGSPKKIVLHTRKPYVRIVR